MAGVQSLKRKGEDSELNLRTTLIKLLRIITELHVESL